MSGSLRLNGGTSGYSEITAPDVAGDQTFTLPAAGGEIITNDYANTVEIGSSNITLNADGSANFAGIVQSNNEVIAQGEFCRSRLRSTGNSRFEKRVQETKDSSLDSVVLLTFNRGSDTGKNVCIGCSSDTGITSTAQAKTWSSLIYADGSAYFKGNVTSDGTIGFNLEPDNDANYVTTTEVDEEGNTVENRVYNGPTLDVKAVIQDLQQRVNDRDAVIADLTTRIQALEGGAS